MTQNIVDVCAWFILLRSYHTNLPAGDGMTYNTFNCHPESHRLNLYDELRYKRRLMYWDRTRDDEMR